MVVQQLEMALTPKVRSMKFSRREIQQNDDLRNIGLKDGSTIIVNSPTLRASQTLMRSASPPEVPQLLYKREPQNVEVPLPRRPRVVGFSAEQIEQRVGRLEELGFPRDDCEKALKAAAFNLDRATDYLLSGKIPEPLVINGERINW
jgi:hypothetical protein